jgi:NitT/TauT family transport system ATP-binding protein
MEGSPLRKGTTTATAIRCQKVGLVYADGTEALRAVNLDVPAGSIVSLLGPSGCGKSTLLRVIAGLLRPTDGSVDLFPQDDAAGRLSFVFQEPSLMPWRTAIGNACLPLELVSHLNRAARLDVGRRILRQVGLTSQDDFKFPFQLSGGMKMRVSIARALVTDPAVLLMDEPFAALDDLLRGRLLDMLQQLWISRPRTIVFVTHNIAEAILLSQRIVVMNSGGVVSQIEVPLEYPRDQRMRGSAIFGDCYAAAADLLATAADPH